MVKRQLGQYYTEGNPFTLRPFLAWAKKIGLNNKHVLEPFAGANNIIRGLQSLGFAQQFTSFDIVPTDPAVVFRDTIKDFPQGFELCITNPPWLAKNSAHRRGLLFPDTPHDDLYKHALQLCLDNCKYVAALIPATFLRSGIFHDRLDTVIFLHDQRMFLDTENPVCLALFRTASHQVKVFHDNEFIGALNELETKLPQPTQRIHISFNHPSGSLGFVAFDNTREPSIRFMKGSQLKNYTVGFTSRMVTRIGGRFHNLDSLIDNLNADIEKFRKETKDVFLTPFKGLRKDGHYRRRMDYRLARDFIAKYAHTHS
ncbi:MAG: hypothetical protein A3C88_02680 [Candidatus Yanofskybacteria bacterium RIFCSPHIGHO2_02_FULL_50_12]|uniref:Uncharacterized protein n=1 Tax=Candidatus Yanofskybacteria bacterium RIFCSPHIGHO2_02_FULL_50_12 TaxID=1802685 RepID=A0A1F8FW85_9BACT|nr:MAG: hypothetical protein A3C88_02680 [Candidatus Yanofskybacteria bacterium RIFCSPHIGHO2_02_FULL_50_12]